MPMFLDNHARAFAHFSPLKANVDDMLVSGSKIREELEYVVDDSEAYGVLTEDTYLENCPEILKQMERITALLQNSSQNIMHDDEAFSIDIESTGLTTSIQQFLALHTFILATLASHSAAIQRTGPWYDSMSRSVNAQRASMLRFKVFVEERYADVKVRTAGGWREVEGVWASVQERYPLPSEIIVVD